MIIYEADTCNIRIPIPEILQGKYELVYQFDVEALLKYIRRNCYQNSISESFRYQCYPIEPLQFRSEKTKKTTTGKIIGTIPQCIIGCISNYAESYSWYYCWGIQIILPTIQPVVVNVLLCLLFQ